MRQNLLFDLPGKQCEVTLENGSLVLKTPYDPSLVAQIKSLPYQDRKWDPTRKVWLISPGQAQLLSIILSSYFTEVTIPQVNQKVVTETRLLKIHYIGMAKDHGDGEQVAFGMDSQGAWSALFPEKVLKSWFEADDAEDPTQSVTLYGVLGISKSADPDQLKTAFRRLALQWHPDKCREPNAHEVFLRIQEAYNILSNQNKRARYDAGLALEKSLGQKTEPNKFADLSAGYRSPLRCGFIMATGHPQLDRFVVEKILAWEDITNAKGQILVASWVYGDKQPTKVWA